ncbi:MAG: hypothetical protein VX899_25035 [Myxococcota bacterium]|nr:hypothetical protein [Myxococcota bacterium]
MSAVPPAVPHEFPLSHASFRQGDQVGTWTEVCIVDGALVVETNQALDERAGVQLRITSPTGRSLGVMTQPPLRIHEAGQTDLWLLPLGLPIQELVDLQADQAPAYRPVQELPRARRGMSRTGNISLLLATLALAGAAALSVGMWLS